MNFVFLIYVSRSGSTMLANEISMHAGNAVVLPEFRLLDILMAEGDARVRRMTEEQLRRLIMLDHQLSNLRLSDTEIAELVRGCAGHGVRALMEALVNCFAAAQGKKPEYALIKLGSLAMIANSVMTLFPEARFLHVYRDVRGVVNSLVRNRNPYFPRHRMGRGDPFHIARQWRAFMERTKSLGATHSTRFSEVRYEELCASPAAVVKGVLENWGMAYVENTAQSDRLVIGERENSIHRLVGSTPAPDRIDAWKTELAPWQGLVTEIMAGKAMHNWNYEPFFIGRISKAAFPFLVMRGILEHFVRTNHYAFSRLIYYCGHFPFFLNRIKLAITRFKDG